VLHYWIKFAQSVCVFVKVQVLCLFAVVVFRLVAGSQHARSSHAIHYSPGSDELFLQVLQRPKGKRLVTRVLKCMCDARPVGLRSLLLLLIVIVICLANFDIAVVATCVALPLYYHEAILFFMLRNLEHIVQPFGQATPQQIDLFKILYPLLDSFTLPKQSFALAVCCCCCCCCCSNCCCNQQPY
jgi:hypothetical protein